jgi:hypothetical protein
MAVELLVQILNYADADRCPRFRHFEKKRQDTAPRT